MANAWVDVVDEVNDGNTDGSHLCFQNCIYHYTDGTESQPGFRFIWRDGENKRKDGMPKLKPQRGQARIENERHLNDLLDKASKAGWYKK